MFDLVGFRSNAKARAPSEQHGEGAASVPRGVGTLLIPDPQRSMVKRRNAFVKSLQKNQIAVVGRAIVVVLIVGCWSAVAEGAKRTVCTITVNSADEKEAFQRHLRGDEYEFVELVEPGRTDWLASACRRQLRCDALIVSGHFNGAEFYSDKIDGDEFLPVQELERASCSASCPGLFSQLKEVYLFGCNTLNPEAIPSVTAEIERSLERSGRSTAEAIRVSRTLAVRRAQSIRDVARRLFVNVPAIYGFSSTAPLGRTAASLIDRYFQSAPGEKIGIGSLNRSLLASFAGHSMTVVAGLSSSDPQAGERAQACRLVDERLLAAEKLAFIHGLLRREVAEARVFLNEIESFLSSLSPTARDDPAVAAALDEIVQDRVSKDRFLSFARYTDQPAIRVRLMGVARDLGWLSAVDFRGELLRTIQDLLAKPSMTTADVDLICTLNDLDGALSELGVSQLTADRADQAAALACLGSSQHHRQMLRALTSPNAEDIKMAEVYFHRRPIGDREELRVAAAAIGLMPVSEMQARAIDILARQHVTDAESLTAVTRLFPLARTIDVQRAIAGLIIRSDYRAIATPATVHMLRQNRLNSPGGQDIIDILIRRLEAS